MLMCDWISDVCSSDLLAVDPEVEADRRQFLERYILGQTVYHVKKTGRIVERAGLRQRIDDLVQVARRQMEVTAPAAGQIPVHLLGLLGRVRNGEREQRFRRRTEAPTVRLLADCQQLVQEGGRPSPV